jgi:hypothetical protein
MATESDRNSFISSDAEAIDLRAYRGTRLMRISRIIEPGLSPEVAGGLDGIDAGRLPPRLLVAGAMDRAVMRAAERDAIGKI